MSGVHLRHAVHRGSSSCSGLLIDTALVGEREARRRILELAPLGSSVFRNGDVLIAVFREALRLDSAAAPGAPLVRQGRLLSPAPLAEDELQQLDGPADAVVFVVGGTATAVLLDKLEALDPSSWLDLEEFVLVSHVASLGEVVASPRAAALPAPVDVRKALGAAALSHEAKAVQEALRARAAKGPNEAGGASLAAALGGVLSGIWHAIKSLISRARPTAPARAVVVREGGAGSANSWLSRVGGALSHLAARALLGSRLAPLLGRRHAEYLARMLEMFDSNQLDDALRHAIPLSSEVARALRLPLSTPSPRSDLSIVPARQAASSTLGLGDDLFEGLRRRYRAAFHRLAARGDVEKAAFVLAELLESNEEAIAFLEGHRRFELAAEIAEARELPAGLTIRLWFLAGDRARAIRIARRTGAFADALLRLEKTHAQEARALRTLWADTLATSGAYAAAVDAVWPVVDARNLALAWLDRAIEVGGATGSSMLARKARLIPSAFPEIRDRVLQLLNDEQTERSTVQALGRELAATESTPEARALARATVRRLLHRIEAHEEGRLVQRLLDFCGDAALRADARAAQLASGDALEGRRKPALASRLDPADIHRSAGDRGALPVLDAAELPDGKLLVALGEMGVWLLSRDGKPLTRFSEPASRLVISDHGDRALLLAKRGEVCRVTRVDLLGRRVRRWCDVRFDQFCPDFDGSTWWVAEGDTVYQIDTTAEDWEYVWKVEQRGAQMASMRRDSTRACFWWAQPHGDGEVWRFELPSLTLRQRQPLACAGNPFFTAGVSASGDFAGWTEGGAGGLLARTWARGAWQDLPIETTALPEAPLVTDRWLIVPAVAPEGATIHLFDAGERRLRARIRLDGAGCVGVRDQTNHLVVCDECGRLLVVSLDDGSIVREHRLS